MKHYFYKYTLEYVIGPLSSFMTRLAVKLIVLTINSRPEPNGNKR